MNSVKLTNIKIRVRDTEHSYRVQEYLFSQGVEWSHYDDCLVRFTLEPILCVDSRLKLSYCDNVDYFDDISYREFKVL